MNARLNGAQDYVTYRCGFKTIYRYLTAFYVILHMHHIRITIFLELTAVTVMAGFYLYERRLQDISYRMLPESTL